MCKNNEEIILTNNNDFIYASYHARREANNWNKCAKILLDNSKMNFQAYILLLLSSELYLKSLLMILDVDIIDNKKYKVGHDLYKLYNLLPDEQLKETIKKNTVFNRYKGINDNDEDIFLETFDDFLKYIANGFKDYRYSYEKFLFDKTIDIPVGFIYNLNHFLNKICNNIVYEKKDENNNFVDVDNPNILIHYPDIGWRPVE